jgi:hypothetical protein
MTVQVPNLSPTVTGFFAKLASVPVFWEETAVREPLV